MYGERDYTSDSRHYNRYTIVISPTSALIAEGKSDFVKDSDVGKLWYNTGWSSDSHYWKYVPEVGTIDEALAHMRVWLEIHT